MDQQFEEVLAAAQAGQDWAFAVLYRALNPGLQRYLSARSSAGVAEDVAAETWLAAARQLSRFDGGEAAFRAWLFTIGRNRLVQHWRDQGRTPQVSFDPAHLSDHRAPDDTERDTVAGMSAQDAARAIAEVLTPDQADVVLLRVIAGLDVDEVAAILDKRPGTVRVLQHKALRKLAGHFSVEALTL